MAETLKIGIVGAGLNSNYHISFSQAYQGAEIVGLADRDLDKAKETAGRYNIARTFGSVAELLRDASPDIVHIVTPPRTHAAVVAEVLQAGRHVLVEKPLALDGREARAMYELAERHQVRLCPIHNHMFDPCMLRADALIKAGALGDIIHVESHYGLNTLIPAFRDYPQPNVLPWLYGLPGGVYQDFLPHALYPLLEHVGAPKSITVKHRATGVLPQRLPDEIRILVDGEKAFGHVVVSFAARPHLHYIRVHGTKGLVEVDVNTMTTVFHPLSGLPNAVRKLTYNFDESWDRSTSAVSNVFQFVTGKLKAYHGMMNLIHRYYDAVKSGGPVPVSKEQALLVVDTMDQVFAQMQYEPLRHEPIAPARTTQPAPNGKHVLVTGGTGFVGKRVVRRLVADGHHVRVLARKLSRVEPIAALGAEIVWGDVADLTSFESAMAGCDTVVHLAAGTSGSERDSETATLQGTRNLLALCAKLKPARLVYISSCSVYGVADYAADSVVGETAPLERFPDRRGSYSASKQRAEQDVAEYIRSGTSPAVILRPGTIFGPGGELFTPLMGFGGGSTYVVIGRGQFVLPFVHVDNLAEAITLAMDKAEAVGETFNVVDQEPLTKRAYVDRVIRRVHPKARVFYLPFAILYGITWFQEIAFGLMKRRPVLTRYRLTSSQRSVTYDAGKLASKLGWKPVLPMPAALDDLVAFERSRQPVAQGQPAR